MSEFKRENRYIVIKRRRILSYAQGHAPTAEKLERKILDQIPEEALVECVVVERDWPEYEQVWSMLAARVDHGDQHLPPPRRELGQQSDAFLVWLPRLVADYEKQARLNEFTPDVSLDFVRRALAEYQHAARQPGARPAQPAPIPTATRLPTEADADWMGCVLAYADDADWQLWDWSRVESRYFSHWQPTGLARPAAPGGE